MEIISISGIKNENKLKIKYCKDFDKIYLTRYLKSVSPIKSNKVKYKIEEHKPFYDAEPPDFVGEITVSYQKS